MGAAAALRVYPAEARYFVAFAQTWWQLMIFRFLAALGIGGEWAIGASLLSETWPKKWRPWIAAVLQCAVNFGILAAILSVALLGNFVDLEKQPKWVFLIGVLPAFVTLWIRHAVPGPVDHHIRAVQPESNAVVIERTHDHVLLGTTSDRAAVGIAAATPRFDLAPVIERIAVAADRRDIVGVDMESHDSLLVNSCDGVAFR